MSKFNKVKHVDRNIWENFILLGSNLEDEGQHVTSKLKIFRLKNVIQNLCFIMTKKWQLLVNKAFRKGCKIN